MSWRPPDWKNPAQGMFDKCNQSYPQGIPKGYHIAQDAGFEEGYEAGADAIVEALKTKGSYIERSLYSNPLYIMWDIGNGWLVWIPEDK